MEGRAGRGGWGGHHLAAHVAVTVHCGDVQGVDLSARETPLNVRIGTARRARKLRAGSCDKPGAGHQAGCGLAMPPVVATIVGQVSRESRLPSK